MDRKVLLLPVQRERTQTFGLLLCAVFFVCGSLIGTVAAGFVDSAGQLGGTVSDYLLFMSDKAQVQPALAASLLDSFKYHLAAVFMGFSILGVFCIPLISAARGFFLSFSVSVLVRLLGAKGILLTLSMFGISTLITVPCLFILSVAAFTSSSGLLRLSMPKNSKPSGFQISGRTVAVCAACLVLLLASAFIDTYLTPLLVQNAAAHISF